MVLLCTSIALPLVGCQSAPPTHSLDSALVDYRSKRYRMAHSRAAVIAGESKGLRRDQASYLAGLSAYKLGNLNQAQQQLTRAAESPDGATAGKAKAVLGLVRVEQHRPREAAALLAEASGALTGEDSRQAAYQASLAYQLAGDETSAGAWQRIAKAGRAGGQQILAMSPRGGAGRFSLQAGAFRQRKHADNAARNVAQVVQKHGLGGIRIIERRDERGRILYLVQFGAFQTRSAASNARRLVGRLEVIVAPSIGPTS